MLRLHIQGPLFFSFLARSTTTSPPFFLSHFLILACSISTSSPPLPLPPPSSDPAAHLFARPHSPAATYLPQVAKLQAGAEGGWSAEGAGGGELQAQARQQAARPRWALLTTASGCACAWPPGPRPAGCSRSGLPAAPPTPCKRGSHGCFTRSRGLHECFTRTRGPHARST